MHSEYDGMHGTQLVLMLILLGFFLGGAWGWGPMGIPMFLKSLGH